MKLLTLGLILSYLTGCANRQIVKESEVIYIKPPVITQCKRYSIQECKPETNGELFGCTLEITKQLNLCADQVEQLKRWQNGI